MREVVQVQVGGSARRLGRAYWELLCEEHGVDSTTGTLCGGSEARQERIHVSFQEGDASGRYVPRAVVVDSCPVGGEEGLFRRVVDDSGGGGGAEGLWSRGNRAVGSKLLQPALECVRREMEACDAPQGVQMVYSLGGGTGSGFGSLLLSGVREEFCQTSLMTFPLLPAPCDSWTVQPYNAVLALQYMNCCADLALLLDKGALARRAQARGGAPSSSPLQVACAAVSGVTCGMRFPGELVTDMKKLAVNLAPFPRRHFLTVSHAPRSSSLLLDQTSCLATCDPSRARFMSHLTVFRGASSSPDEQQAPPPRMRMVDWATSVPAGVLHFPQAPVPGGADATLLGNHCAMGDQVLQPLAQQCSALLERKAHLEKFQADGVDQMEILDALSEVQDLISEYEDDVE